MAEFSSYTKQIVASMVEKGLWFKLTEDQQRCILHEAESEYYAGTNPDLIRAVTLEAPKPNYERAKKERELAKLYVPSPRAQLHQQRPEPVLEIPAEAARIIIEPVSVREKPEPVLMTRPAEPEKPKVTSQTPKPEAIKPKETPIAVPPKPKTNPQPQQQQSSSQQKLNETFAKGMQGAMRQFIVATAEANGATKEQASEMAKNFMNGGFVDAIMSSINEAMANGINSPRPEPVVESEKPKDNQRKSTQTPRPIPQPQPQQNQQGEQIPIITQQPIPAPQPEAAAEAFNAVHFVSNGAPQQGQFAPDVTNPVLRHLNARAIQGQQPQSKAQIAINYPVQWNSMNSYQKCEWIDSLLRNYPGTYPQIYDAWDQVDDKGKIAGLKNYMTFLGGHPQMHHIEFVSLVNLLTGTRLKSKMASANTVSTADDPRLVEIPVTKYASNFGDKYNWCFEVESNDPTQALIVWHSSVPVLSDQTGQWYFPSRMEVYKKRREYKGNKGRGQWKGQQPSPTPQPQPQQNQQPDPNAVTVGQVVDNNAANP